MQPRTGERSEAMGGDFCDGIWFVPPPLPIAPREVANLAYFAPSLALACRCVIGA